MADTAPTPDKAKYFTAGEHREPDGRRALPDQRRTFEVSHLWEVHHEIVRRILLGQKNVDIARDLNVTEAMVSYTRNSKPVQDQLTILKSARDAGSVDLAVKIRELAPKALEIVEEALDGNAEGVSPARRLDEANKILDRAGYAPEKKFRGEHLVAHYTADEIEDIKRRAKEDGIVVDTESLEPERTAIPYEDEEVHSEPDNGGGEGD